jgi:hypothetical protein
MKTTAMEGRTYQLDNSGEWFSNACKTKGARTWLQSAIKDGCKVYCQSDTMSSLIHLFARRLGPGTPKIASIASTHRDVNVTLKSGQIHQRTYTARGDGMYAVQYRKLRFKWYSSRDLEKATLEKDNRWKLSPEARGDDVVEVLLDDGLGTKDGNMFISEGGADEFVLDFEEVASDDDEEEDD